MTRWIAWLAVSAFLIALSFAARATPPRAAPPPTLTAG